jgi:hypothetical protein
MQGGAMWTDVFVIFILKLVFQQQNSNHIRIKIQVLLYSLSAPKVSMTEIAVLWVNVRYNKWVLSNQSVNFASKIQSPACLELDASQ